MLIKKMRLRRETVKSVLLLLLIGGSLVQTGILWNDLYHGLPFPLSRVALWWDTMGSGTTDARQVMEDTWQPDQLVLSDGYNESKWLFGSYAGGQKEIFEKLRPEWRAIAAGVGNAGNGDWQRSEEGVWIDDLRKPHLMAQWSQPVPPEIMAGLTGVPGKKAPFKSVSAVLWFPSEREKGQNIRVTVLDNDRHVWQGSLAAKDTQMSADGFSALVSSQQKLESADIYTYFDEFAPDPARATQNKTRPEMVFEKTGSRYHTLPVYSIFVPAELGGDSGEPELEKAAGFILGHARESYLVSIDKSGQLTMSNSNGVFRMTPDAVLTYKAAGPDAAEDKNNAGQALSVAATFLADRGLMRPGADATLVLTGAVQTEGRGWHFSFDWRVDGRIISLWYKGDAQTLTHAAELDISGGKVSEARVMYRRLTRIREERRVAAQFTDALDLLTKQNPELRVRRPFLPDNLSEGYLFKGQSKTTRLEPLILVHGSNGEWYSAATGQ